jgi:hypothetical protein
LFDSFWLSIPVAFGHDEGAFGSGLVQLLLRRQSAERWFLEGRWLRHCGHRSHQRQQGPNDPSRLLLLLLLLLLPAECAAGRHKPTYKSRQQQDGPPLRKEKRKEE